MRKLMFAGALALAVTTHVHAGPRCPKLGQRLAAHRPATATPVRVMPCVGAAIVQPVAKVFRVLAAPVPATCANGKCVTD